MYNSKDPTCDAADEGGDDDDDEGLRYCRVGTPEDRFGCWWSRIWPWGG